MATESTLRYAEERSLGPLDGVLVSVKDDLDVVPYPSTAGTLSALSTPIEDSTVISRLRSQGAIILGVALVLHAGKTNMTELAMGVFGDNSHYGWPRNPFVFFLSLLRKLIIHAVVLHRDVLRLWLAVYVPYPLHLIVEDRFVYRLLNVDKLV